MVSYYRPEATRAISDYLPLQTAATSRIRVSSLSAPDMIRMAKDKSPNCDLVSWLKGLSPQCRQQMMSIRDPILTSLLIQLYYYKVENGAYKAKFKYDTTSRKDTMIFDVAYIHDYFEVSAYHLDFNYQAEEERFEKSLRFTDTLEYLDTLTIDLELVGDVESLIECMRKISAGKVFTVPCKQFKTTSKKSSWEYPPWLINNEFSHRELARWACGGIEQGIWINYLSHRKNIELDCLGYSLLHSESILSLSTNSKRNSIGSLQALKSEFIRRKKVLKPFEYSIRSYGSDELPTKNMKFNTALSANRQNLVHYYLPKSLTLLIDQFNSTRFEDYLHYLALTPLDRAMTPFDLSARIVLSNLSKTTATDALDSLLNDLGRERPKPKRKKHKKAVLIPSPADSPQLSSEEEPGETLPDPVPNYAFSEDFDTKSEGFQIVTSKRNKNKTRQETKSAQRYNKKNPARSPRPLRPLASADDFLHKEIISFFKQLRWRTANKKQSVFKVVEQLTRIVNAVFPGSAVTLFGSYATGLCLESSDVDLQVTNPLYTTRATIQFACVELARNLALSPWLSNLQCIDTASIPVVKLDADLTHFSKENGLVRIDITFDDSNGNHLGLQSLKLTRELLLKHESIEKLVVVVKSLLAINELNDSYKGGLSSYSVLIWIIAFINSLICAPNDLGELLIKFLEFYGKKFAVQSTGIDISGGGSFFDLQDSRGVLTVNPVRKSNNTTRTAYNIDKVLRVFESAYNNITSLKTSGITRDLLKLTLKFYN